MNSVALVLAVLAILVFVLILQQQQLAPQQPQSNKVVYVQPNDITPIWWGTTLHTHLQIQQRSLLSHI